MKIFNMAKSFQISNEQEKTEYRDLVERKVRDQLTIEKDEAIDKLRTEMGAQIDFEKSKLAKLVDEI